MSARPLKLLSSSVEHLADQLRRQVVLAQQCPEQTRRRDGERHGHARHKRHIACQQSKAAVDVLTERFGKPIDDRQVFHSVLGQSSAISGNPGSPLVRSGLSVVKSARVLGRYASGLPPGPARGTCPPNPLPLWNSKMRWVLPAGGRAMLEACLRHDPRSRSAIHLLIVIPSCRCLSTGGV